MCYVYIAECGDGSLYTGWTTDLNRRIRMHCEGRGGRYTRSKPPVVLRYFEELSTKSEAMKREYEIKALSRSGKLSLIESFVHKNSPK